MRSARLRTTSILCSTSRMVRSPAAFSFLIRSRITGTSSIDMPAVGSSNMKTCGSSAIISATSSLRLSPCGSAAAAKMPLVGQRHLFQEMLGAIDPVGVRRPAAPEVGSARAFRLHREADVLADREIGKQVGDLERAADAAAGALGGAEAGDVLAVEMHRARRRRQLAGHQVEVGGLAGAVRADDGGERSRH